MNQFPKGPTTPRWWQLVQWIANPLGYLDACVRDYGDVFATRIGSQTWVIVNHPQAMQKILTGKEFEAFGEVNKELFVPLVGEHSLLVLSGDDHKQRRKLVMPPFHGERMHNYGQIICDIARQMACSWNPGHPFQVSDAMLEMVTDVILQTVFGFQKGSKLNQVRQLLTERLNLTGTPLGAMVILFPFLQQDLGKWSPWGRIEQKQQQLDALLYSEIAARRAHPDPNRTDILSLLISARDEDGKGMSDRQLRDESLTFLIAGHQTISLALSWAFYWIHKLPEVKKTLKEELECLPENPEPMEITKLPYLTAVCNETLRIYPTVLLTMPRVTRSRVELMGHQLDAGITVIGSGYLTHHREDLYPNPKQFRPSRFLEKQFSPYEFIPFGGGQRSCIGMALAQLEMKLVLATVLLEVDLALAENQSVQPKRRSLNVGPDPHFKLVVTSRC